MASKETNQNSLNIFAFWKAQQTAWKVTVYRTSMERLGYKAVLPYLSLYIVLMGATKAQIGYVTSLGMIVSALMAPFLGQHIDRHGPKKMYIFGIAVLLGGYIALWGAPVWQVAALGMFLHTMGPHWVVSPVQISAVTVWNPATVPKVCWFAKPSLPVHWV